MSGQVPGKEIRLSAGDTLAAEVSNQLPNKTTTPTSASSSTGASTHR